MRLPFNPEYYGFKLSDYGEPAAQVDFVALDRAIAAAEQYGLPVIIDVHPGGDFVDTLENHARLEKSFINLWQQIAERYKNHASSLLIFELLNEPQYYKAELRWTRLYTRLVEAIRAISPDRIIIIGAPHGSDVDALQYLQTSDDPRLIYAFHFYEPYLVTHQGIHMGFEKKMIRYFRSTPYPSTLATQDADIYAPTAPKPEQAQSELEEYVKTPWDAAHIAARIEIAKDWAATHHVSCSVWRVWRVTQSHRRRLALPLDHRCAHGL